MSSIPMLTSSTSSTSSSSSSTSSECDKPKQQQHRKRTRATAEQLAVLEDTFAVNVSPNAKLRKQLSERLLMSERSIQIWFQNRRAKVKHMKKRAQLQMQQAAIRAQVYQQQLWQHMTTMAAVPRTPAYNAMLRAQSADAIISNNNNNHNNNNNTSSSSSSGTHHPHPLLLQQRHESMPPHKPSPPLTTTTCLSSSSSIINNNNNDLFILSATTLIVGTWQRLALHATDLMCTFSQSAFQWHICDSGLQFKIHIPVETISSIEHAGNDEVHIDLLEAPLFYMLTDKVWTQCSDFSENRQASTFLRHTLKGVAESLRQDLLTVVNMSPSPMSQLVRFIDLTPMPCTTSTPNAAPSILMDPAITMASVTPSFVPEYWPSTVPQQQLMSTVTVGGMGEFFLT